MSLAILPLMWTLPAVAQEGLSKPDPTSRPLEGGVLVQGGKGVTDQRNDYIFLMAGGHAGKVLTGNFGPGRLRGNFEFAAELYPFWQSYTPKVERTKCSDVNGFLSCSPNYTVGGTFTGITVTPIILRWNFAGTRRLTPWVQGAGGLLWTNHKYPPFGTTQQSIANSGPDSETSVWNFTPQFGVGLHYFVAPRRSIDFGANAVHISSASLGDRNPGVNASVQFNVGYTWWQ